MCVTKVANQSCELWPLLKLKMAYNFDATLTLINTCWCSIPGVLGTAGYTRMCVNVEVILYIGV